MQTETVFKVAFGVWAVLFIMPVVHANRKAKLEHGSRIAQAANEYAPLLWVRVFVGVPIWAFLRKRQLNARQNRACFAKIGRIR